MIATVAYRPEHTDSGWLVWRSAGGAAEVALPRMSGSPRAMVYRTRREVADAIRTAARHDRGAAGRLGIEVQIAGVPPEDES